MYEKVITNFPEFRGVKLHLKNFAQTQNIKIVPERGCRITVGSAEEPDSVRSQDAKMAHFSEIGLYPNTEKKKTEDLISSITGSIPRQALTLIAYESTAKGVGNYFHEEWEKAYKGESVFDPVFIPWFLIGIYREAFDGRYYNHKGRKVKGTMEQFISTMTPYEKNLFKNHKECTLEHINWYRGKLSEMSSHSLMKQEFPSDPIEAFQDSGLPAFRAEDVEAMRPECMPNESIGTISADVPASTAKGNPSDRRKILSNVQFISEPVSMNADPKSRSLSERNKLRVWQHLTRSN